MNRNDLERLSKDELIEMALRLQRPDKTSRNSSKPPSTDRKEKRENSKPGGAKPGHEGHTRSLTEDPDVTEDHAPTHCPCCGLPFDEDSDRVMMGEYDEIELPPMQPFVRRHRRCRFPSEFEPFSPEIPLPDDPRRIVKAVEHRDDMLLQWDQITVEKLGQFSAEFNNQCFAERASRG